MIHVPVNGIIVPALTFFDEKYKINKELNTLLLRHNILNGANALFLFGSTGEGNFFANKIKEKIKYIEIALELAKDTLPILTGVFGDETDGIIDEIENLGTKFSNLNFVISPPVSKKLEVADLKSYFETILGSLKVKNPIYLYNNPPIFGENLIDPNIVSWLLSFSNLAGIKDSTDKLNLYKSYIEFLSEEFGVYCGKEEKFSAFLGLVPKNKRKLTGLVPSISNLVNLCSNLYYASVHEEIIELHHLQEELNDVRYKIYDVQQNVGKQQRGLKHAFYNLYGDVIQTPLKEVFMVSPELQSSLDEVTVDRISATVNYLKNRNFIYRLYPIGDKLYNIYEFNNLFLEIEELKHLGAINKIKGPYEGKINIIYRLKSELNDVVLRARLSKAFRYENLIKEKVLYPFLDGTLTPDTPDLREKIKAVLKKERGQYLFDEDNPSIIPVSDLLYFDEREDIIPYKFTIQNYIRGKPLFYLLQTYKHENTNLKSIKLLNLFNNLGGLLAKLHEIRFDGFHETILNIGKDSKNSWADVFNSQLEKELTLAKKNKVEFTEQIKNYISDNFSLIEEETEPVLFHNDFQGQNIIVREGPKGIEVNGLIDFDNWSIGVRPADFVKMEYWTIDPLNEPALKESFYQGYINVYRDSIGRDFTRKIELHKVLWLLKVYNFEKEKEKLLEQKESVGMRFPITDTYLKDLKDIVFE